MDKEQHSRSGPFGRCLACGPAASAPRFKSRPTANDSSSISHRPDRRHERRSRSSSIGRPDSTSRARLLMPHLELIALIVRDYDRAIRFFVDVLQFDLIEDAPSLTNDGRPKRWVVVRPRGAQTGILLARADGDRQASAIGEQFAGRVGLFLRVDDFEAAYERMRAAGVQFVSGPRDEPYARLAVFLDLDRRRCDLLGPRPERNVL